MRDRAAAGNPLSESCVSALNDWISSSANTFTGIRQSVSAKINLWINPYVDAATSESDFDLRKFRTKPISLYLGVSPDNKIGSASGREGVGQYVQIMGVAG